MLERQDFENIKPIIGNLRLVYTALENQMMQLLLRQRKPKGQSRMDNPETLATLGIQDIGRNKRQRKPKGQSRMDNPETLATLGIQDIGRNKR